MSNSAPTAPGAPRKPITSVFRHRNYRLFFIGQLISLLGTWMQIIAQAWLVYRITGSPLALGLIGFLQQGPVFFFAAFGGAFADRVDRRKLLIWLKILAVPQAFGLAALAFWSGTELWHVAVLALGFGLLNAIEIPVRQSFTVEMVGRDDLQPAVALNSIMFNMSRVIGPSIAGVTIAAVGEAWCFIINGVTFFAVIASLVMMETKPVTERSTTKAWRDVVEGFQYVTGHREIRAALVALALTSFAGGPYLTLMPVFAREVLHTDSAGYGFLMTLVGGGALFGALLMSRLSHDMLKAAPSVAAVGFGLALVAFSLAQSFWLAAVLILPTAFALMVQGSTTNIRIQLAVEDRMRGRVMAYYTIAFLGVIPFGSLAAGAIAHYIGVPLTLTCGGIVCALGGAGAMWRRKKREAEPPPPPTGALLDNPIPDEAVGP